MNDKAGGVAVGVVVGIVVVASCLIIAAAGFAWDQFQKRRSEQKLNKEELDALQAKVAQSEQNAAQVITKQSELIASLVAENTSIRKPITNQLQEVK